MATLHACRAHSSVKGVSNAVPRWRAWNGSEADDAVIRVYDEAGNAIATHEYAGELKEP